MKNIFKFAFLSHELLQYKQKKYQDFKTRRNKTRPTEDQDKTLDVKTFSRPRQDFQKVSSCLSLVHPQTLPQLLRQQLFRSSHRDCAFFAARAKIVLSSSQPQKMQCQRVTFCYFSFSCIFAFYSHHFCHCGIYSPSIHIIFVTAEFIPSGNRNFLVFRIFVGVTTMQTLTTLVVSMRAPHAVSQANQILYVHFTSTNHNHQR